jgi:hypothetical protein
MDFNKLTDEEKNFLVQCLPPNQTGDKIYEKITGRANNSIDFSVLSSEVNLLHTAQENFDVAWDNFYKSIVPLLDPLDRFWQIVDSLKDRLVNCDFNAKAAIREMFRLSQVSGPGRKEFSFSELVQFAKTWDELSGNLYEPLFEVITGKSDDGYGDLLDSLPLAGKVIYEQCLKGQIKNNQDLLDKIHSQENSHHLPDFIFNGENYFAMNLMDTAKKRVHLELDEVQ